MRFLFLLIAALASAQDPRFQDFDAIAQTGMRALKVPGLAVGVIENGKVVFAKGYGARDLRSNSPVTTRTQFAMGSVTKSFTSAVAATLVDQGKLNWDTPVRDYLPWFRMHDPVATDLITIRDMLSHRSGLPRHDFIRFSTHLTREELVRRIRHLPPNHSFRDLYQYNNLMYVTAGYLSGVLAGSTWEDLVRDRIFHPIGMSRSTVSTRDMRQSDDFASPHSESREQEFYYYQEFGVGPNGAVNSCIDDMLKYLQMYLDGGRANGTQILSQAQLRELQKPVTTVGPGASYALAWRTDYHRGHYRISHGGAITGFRASVAVFPSQKLAIVAMINDESSLADLLTQALADRALKLPPVDYLRRERNSSPAQRPAPSPVPNTTPTLALDAYAGTYFHPAYGKIAIANSNGRLRIRFDALEIPLTHFHYDTFSPGSPLSGFVRFAQNEKGSVHEVHLPLEPAVKPFVFVRTTP